MQRIIQAFRKTLLLHYNFEFRLCYKTQRNNVDSRSIIHRARRKDILIFAGLLPLLSILVFFNQTLDYSKILTKKSEIPILKEKASLSSIALLAHGNLAKKYAKPVKFQAQKISQPEKVIFGNPEFGYFETPNLGSHTNIEAQIIPFTFREAIHFCASNSDGEMEWLGEKKFSDPTPHIFKNIKTEVQGQFSQNFFLLSAQFVPDDQNANQRSYLPIVANKYGELIWGHLPKNGKQSFKKYLTVKQIGPGEYGLLFGEKYSYFEKFNYLGEIQESIEPKFLESPFVMHHDFIYLGTSKLLTLGHKLHYVRSTLPLQKKLMSLNSWLLRPTKLLSTPLIAVDLRQQTATNVWDPIASFNPLKGTPWARNLEHAKLALKQPGRHFSSWKESKAQVDWTHANSIEHYPGVGILVSMRNLSKIALLDEKTHKVLWTIGNHSTDTYQPLNEKHAFYHQHHAQLLGDGLILIMDNHTAPPAPKQIGSRVLIIGLNKKNNKAQVVWNYQPQSFLHIGNRGSAYELENKNILAFYPASLHLMDHMVEISRISGQPEARMKLYFTNIKRNFSDKQLKQMTDAGLNPIRTIQEGGGNRAVPIHTLGTEVASNVECTR